nr:hypothetical protein [Tanacetum cinerariifolium]
MLGFVGWWKSQPGRVSVQDRDPKVEVQIYTWMDAALCQLIDMVLKFEGLLLTRNLCTLQEEITLPGVNGAADETRAQIVADLSLAEKIR